MEGKNTVPILEKALDVLEYIGASSGAVTLPELQRQLGIAQASCYRIVTTLVRRGWLEKCSGGRYEIAAGITRASGKLGFRLEKYQHLQPAMNRLADQAGFPAKFSVRDGEDFVNVCSARNRTGQFSFSEPGFRLPLSRPASVSAIFLAESPPAEREKLMGGKAEERFRDLQEFYRENGCCFIHGQPGRDAEYPFDTLSFPVRKGGRLAGVISFLSLPGVLNEERPRLARLMRETLSGIVDAL